MSVGVYNTAINNDSPNYNHITTTSGTMTLAAYSAKQNETIDSGDTFTWASSDTGVATVSGGTVTAVATGVCTITATSVNGNGEGFFPLGVALLTLGSSSIAFGSSTTISCNGGGSTTKWMTGTPGVIALAGTLDPNTGFVTGASITVNTISGAFTQTSSNPPATATAHCPIFCVVSNGTNVGCKRLSRNDGGRQRKLRRDIRIAQFNGYFCPALARQLSTVSVQQFHVFKEIYVTTLGRSGRRILLDYCAGGFWRLLDGAYRDYQNLRVAEREYRAYSPPHQQPGRTNHSPVVARNLYFRFPHMQRPKSLQLHPERVQVP